MLARLLCCRSSVAWHCIPPSSLAMLEQVEDGYHRHQVRHWHNKLTVPDRSLILREPTGYQQGPDGVHPAATSALYSQHILSRGMPPGMTFLGMSSSNGRHVRHVDVAQQPERRPILQSRLVQLLVHLHRVPAHSKPSITGGVQCCGSRFQANSRPHLRMAVKHTVSSECVCGPTCAACGCKTAAEFARLCNISHQPLILSTIGRAPGHWRRSALCINGPLRQALVGPLRPLLLLLRIMFPPSVPLVAARKWFKPADITQAAAHWVSPSH